MTGRNLENISELKYLEFMLDRLGKEGVKCCKKVKNKKNWGFNHVVSEW